jgi:two-component system sensor histidine kinase QseC
VNKNNPPAGTYSLKRRLLLAVLGTVAIVWCATAAYSYFDARHEVNRLLDAHLAQAASLIVAQVGHELEEIDLEHAPRLDKQSRRVAFQIWEKGDTLRLHSANAPQQRMSPRAEGFSDVRVDGRRWRVFSAWDARREFLVQVGEREETRGEIAAGIAMNLLAPLLLALPALGVFVWLSIAGALRPLPVLGREVEDRRPDDLAPLKADDAPAEVAPLVRSLNTLFERLGLLIENERRFTADAAHELRTPLAALKTQAQVARAAQDVAGRERALDNVIAGCDRATRLVEQLLTLARLEPAQFSGQAKPCDLRALARLTIGELAPAALDRGIELELAGEEAVTEGHGDLISILLRNLIDNAVRYSRNGGVVRVGTACVGQTASVFVTDQGPGIPREERDKVGRRFYRILGSERGGSGLGLSIVRRVAEIHAATVMMGEGPEGRGLRVTVAFPLKRSKRGAVEVR